jgi:hypothetical protein
MWGRIRFTFEFDGSGADGGTHAEWGHEYLDGHDYVVQADDRPTVSAFVLLEKFELQPPESVSTRRVWE